MFTLGQLSHAGPRTFSFRTEFVERRRRGGGGGGEEGEKIGANVFPVCFPGIRGLQKPTFDVS